MNLARSRASIEVSSTRWVTHSRARPSPIGRLGSRGPGCIAGVLGVVLAFAGILPSTADAQCLQPETLEELTRRADVVLVGVCEQVESSWNDTQTSITTSVAHRVDARGRLLKGTLQDGMHRFVRPGGTVNGVTMSVSSQPGFRVGERSLLFLYRPDRIRFYGVVGAYQGKLRILRDPETGEETVRLWTRRGSDVLYASRPGRDARHVVMPLSELMDRIEEWIREQSADDGRER